MEVHEGTVRSLVRALAKGDLETLERCVCALSTGRKVHSDDRGEDLFPRERLLVAWRCALPPFHRNPTRRAFVEARTKEQRLAGCRVEVWAHGKDIDEGQVVGTIVADHGDAWTVRIHARNGKGQKIPIEMRIAWDDIAACCITPNQEQLQLWHSGHRHGNSPDPLYPFLGLPDWEWFEWNAELAPISSASH